MDYIIYTNSNSEKYEIRIEIDTKGEKINIIGADLYFDSKNISLSQIREDRSIVPIWVEKPELIDSGNAVHFAGMVPGGFEGRGVIATFIFDKNQNTTQKIDNPKIELKNIQTLRNDGVGTSIKSNVFYKKTDISILNEIDTIKPESFKPVIYKYEDKYFIAFSTTDKGSGIKQYEIKEKGEWKIVESPYILKDQTLRSFIYIKAVDNSGNEYITRVNPQNMPFWLIICCIIVGLIALYITWKKVFSK